MLQGIHLTLMIGPALPVPAPKVVMDAVQSVQVTSGKDKSGFQITPRRHADRMQDLSLPWA